MRFTNLCLSGALLLGGAGLVGCETTEETKRVDVKDDGTVVREKTTVSENLDGSVTKEQKKTVDKPND